MSNLLPPLCLLLALLMLLAATVLLAMGSPEPTLELHRARASGDEQHRQRLEAQLENRQGAHHAAIVALFAGGILLTIIAFVAMRPSAPR